MNSKTQIKSMCRLRFLVNCGNYITLTDIVGVNSKYHFDHFNYKIMGQMISKDSLEGSASIEKR